MSRTGRTRSEEAKGSASYYPTPYARAVVLFSISCVKWGERILLPTLTTAFYR